MFGFVILHYQNIDVTKESVECLLKLKGQYKIIIVDNFSPNGTGKELKKVFEKNDKIHVILNEKNIGFAGGNNIGYKYARDILKCDFIVVLNSDVFIKDVSFLNKVNDCALSNPSDAIIAVDIVSRYGGHQNPYRFKAISTLKQFIIIFRKIVGCFVYSIPFINNYIINKKPKSSTSKNFKKINVEMMNIMPHGSCIIYLPEWIKNEDFCFLDGTFLFCEEEILYDYVMKKKYIIRYRPDIEVFHLEDASQEFDYKSLIKKKKFQLKCEIQSRTVLLKYRLKERKKV